MYDVRLWFKSECQSNGWLLYPFNTGLKHHHALIFKCIKDKKSKQIFGELECIKRDKERKNL